MGVAEVAQSHQPLKSTHILEHTIFEGLAYGLVCLNLGKFNLRTIKETSEIRCDDKMYTNCLLS